MSRPHPHRGRNDARHNPRKDKADDAQSPTDPRTHFHPQRPDPHSPLVAIRDTSLCPRSSLPHRRSTRQKSTLQESPLLPGIRGSARKLAPSFPLSPKPLLDCHASGDEPPQDTTDVVVGCENHQHYHQSKPDSEPDFLGPLREGTAAKLLDCVEQKVATVEERNRKQVEQADRYREDGRQSQEVNDAAKGKDLVGYLGNPDRAADLVGRLSADEYPTDIGECPFQDEPGFLHSQGHGLEWGDRLVLLLPRSG